MPRLAALLLFALAAGSAAAAADGVGRKHGPHKRDAADADAQPDVVSGAALASSPPPNVKKSTAGEGLAPFDSPGAALLYRVATALGANEDGAASPLPKPAAPPVDVAAAGAALMG